MLEVMDTLDLSGRSFALARATEPDVPALAALLADDVLGAGREVEQLEPYLDAFREIAADSHHLLLVVREVEIVGTMQLTIIPGLSRGGTKRLQIEAVRLAAGVRGLGLGSALFDWAHRYGRERGATLAQLTTDKSRTDAFRFYERLGYAPSHEGFKRSL